MPEYNEGTPFFRQLCCKDHVLTQWLLFLLMKVIQACKSGGKEIYITDVYTWIQTTGNCTEAILEARCLAAATEWSQLCSQAQC